MSRALGWIAACKSRRPIMQTRTLMAALAVAGCGTVGIEPGPDADAGPDEIEIPAGCGNLAPDPGEDCDGTPGCPRTCHVTPEPGTVAVRFRGAITSVVDPQGAFGGRMPVDEPLWGRIVYATSLPDQAADGGVGDYAYTNSAARDTRGIWLSVARWSFHPDRGTGRVIVGNGAGGADGFYALLGNGVVSPPVIGLQSIVIDLKDPSQAALASDALPAAAFPPAASWTDRRLYVQGDNSMGVAWFVDATLDEVTLETPAP
jgi:hypothetical protein